ncbi:MAG: RDD family protein [Propionibacteriaceae bacterium]|nr:RDD family protein [Propionibacteriaceae bacterium]
MTNSAQQPPAGWYPDPAGSGGERFWDGVAWSQSTRDQEVPPAAPEPQSYATPSGQQYNQSYQQQPYQQQYGQPYQQGYGTPYGSVGPRPAGFWWRFLGYVIDGIILGILTQIVTTMLGIQAALNRASEAWARDMVIWIENSSPDAPFPMPGPDFTAATFQISIVAGILMILYRIGMYAWKSATLGQMALGMKLVKADAPDEKLSMGTIVLRAVVSSVLYSITLVNIANGLAAAFTSKKQTIGDMIARTQVLKIR